jgi:hypothetical protein
MQIVYLPSSQAGLAWFFKYFETSFPEGGPNALTRFDAMERLLVSNPLVGHKVSEKGSREMSILRTPFRVIYQVTEDDIRVLDVIDYRSGRRTWR